MIDCKYKVKIKDIQNKYTFKIFCSSTYKELNDRITQLKNIINQMPQVSGSGTEASLNNTIEAPMTELKVKGNSIQNGTPAPDNEVPILSAGDNGTISQKIINKNLFDYANATIKTGYAKDADGNEITTGSGNYTTSYTKVIPNTTYTFSADLTSAVYRLYFYDKNKNWISRTGAISNSIKHYTFTTPSNCYYIQFQNVKGYATNNEAQLEQSSTATTYTAHQEQTYTIPCQQPMRSIGTVRDEFIQVNGEWKERHNIGRVVLDGTEDWTQTGSQPTVYYTTKITGYKTTNNIPLSNYFVGKNNVASPTVLVGLGDNIIAFISTTDNIRFYLNSSIFNSANELKTWLQSHNTEILYLPITPIDIPCTEEQIYILENLPSSYKEQTNIYSEDTTPAYVEAEGLYDIKNLEARVEALEQ